MPFSKSDRDAAAIYQNVLPGAGLEADHIHPRSKGGADDVANLQFIAPAANRAKSAHVFDPRAWQEDFIQAWDRSERESFLLLAIPGGGKTRAALWAAQRWLQAAHDRRVIIVCPTVEVREQWALEAQRVFGISLQTKAFGTDFRDSFVGGVLTYAAVHQSAALLRTLCARNPTLVIVDEPHHLSVRENAGWGDSAKHAFELARRRLLLTGTPYRTDGEHIPWVRYDTDLCQWDFKYSYPDALQDTVVRGLVFHNSKGQFEEFYCGDRRTLELNGNVSADAASDRLRQILRPGAYVTEILRLAHAKLQSVRQAIPDAGAMAVCMDIHHAEQIAQALHQITGRAPSIVVSEEERATDTIDQYRQSTREWVVSVRQIIEGTDIKRLQVLAYVTNTATEMSFRQLIGRVSRVRFQDPESPRQPEEAEQADLEAYVFLPADPRLIEFARTIEETQRMALAGPEGDPRGPQPESLTPSTRMFLGSEHTGLDQLIVGNQTYAAVDASQIEAMVHATGIKREIAAKLFDLGFRRDGAPRQATEVPAKTDQQICDDLGRECNKRAFRLSKLLQVEVNAIHGRWKAQRTLGIKGLENKLAVLEREISEALNAAQ